MRPGSLGPVALIGWQTLLADLSLILFMVTAAAMSAGAAHGGPKPPAAQPRKSGPTLGEPLAVWRGGGSQSLRHWLSSEQPDPRQQLTITTWYQPGARARALAAAQALIAEAGPMGQTARLIVAPASGTEDEEAVATLAYDEAPQIAGGR